jgi:hypothetical protein
MTVKLEMSDQSALCLEALVDAAVAVIDSKPGFAKRYQESNQRCDVRRLRRIKAALVGAMATSSRPI